MTDLLTPHLFLLLPPRRGWRLDPVLRHVYIRVGMLLRIPWGHLERIACLPFSPRWIAPAGSMLANSAREIASVGGAASTRKRRGVFSIWRCIILETPNYDNISD